MYRSLMAHLLILAVILGGRSLPAEDVGQFPSHPVEVIIPFPAGSGLDVAVRLLAKYAEPELGQSIEVTNHPRGGNIRGNVLSVTAVADGYTLGAWGTNLVTDELLVRGVKYTYRDIIPICMFADDPEIIVVGKRFAEENGIRTLDDLFTHVRSRPGKVSLGVGGNWTAHDFLRLKMETGAEVRFNRIPFLGGRLVLEAVARGNCSVALPYVSELLNFPDRDGVLPLAVAYGERIAHLPDLPTTSEEGYPGMEQTLWRVLTVPRGTPPGIVSRLEEAFSNAFDNAGYQAEAERMGVHTVFRNARDTARFLESEHEYYSVLTRKLGLVRQQ